MFEAMFSKSGLSLDRMRGFLSVAAVGSIAKAAPGDLNRQSLLSRQIKELETYFGVELTRRHGKGLILTAAGTRLAGLIRKQLQDLEDFQKEQTQAPKLFTLGAGASLLDWIVAPVANDIAVVLGNASLRLETYRTSDLVEGVREGTLDLVIVRQDAMPKSAPKIALGAQRLILCIPRPLLAKGASATDLASASTWRNLPFAIGGTGGQLGSAIRDALAKSGVSGECRFQCESLLLVRELVLQGHCAAVLPSLGVEGLPSESIAMLEFPPLRHFRRNLCLHWNRRQMERRGLEEAALKRIGAALKTRLNTLSSL